MILLCQWITAAWQHISPDVTLKGFMECCISTVIDGTDDDMLWNDREENGIVRGEYEQDEGTYSAYGDSDTDG